MLTEYFVTSYQPCRHSLNAPSLRQSPPLKVESFLPRPFPLWRADYASRRDSAPKPTTRSGGLRGTARNYWTLTLSGRAILTSFRPTTDTWLCFRDLPRRARRQQGPAQEGIGLQEGLQLRPHAGGVPLVRARSRGVCLAYH